MSAALASSPRIIVALDFADRARCQALVDQLDPRRCRLKIGKEMFTRFGPTLVEDLHSRGFDLFLDLKFHDIPNTVNKAVAAAADLGVWMLNVHASGGLKMMVAAKEAIAKRQHAPILIAVTVLTSMGEGDLREVGIAGSPAEQVRHLAQLSQQAGLDGVVCSAREAAMLHELCGDDFLCVTPGIRPAGSASDDQSRVMTPAQALANGSDYLVIGRPITQAAEPARVLEGILASIEGAWL